MNIKIMNKIWDFDSADCDDWKQMCDESGGVIIVNNNSDELEEYGKNSAEWRFLFGDENKPPLKNLLLPIRERINWGDNFTLGWAIDVLNSNDSYQMIYAIASIISAYTGRKWCVRIGKGIRKREIAFFYFDTGKWSDRDMDTLISEYFGDYTVWYVWDYHDFEIESIKEPPDMIYDDIVKNWNSHIYIEEKYIQNNLYDIIHVPFGFDGCERDFIDSSYSEVLYEVKKVDDDLDFYELVEM